MAKTAADSLIETIMDWGVDTVFGLHQWHHGSFVLVAGSGLVYSSARQCHQIAYSRGAHLAYIGI